MRASAGFAKVFALIFLVPVMCISGIVSCLSGLGAVLSFAAALISYDCILGVLIWGSVFIVSLPFTLGTFVAIQACFSDYEAIAEISAQGNQEALAPRPEKLLFRVPAGWQTGLIISVILFVMGLIWKVTNN